MRNQLVYKKAYNGKMETVLERYLPDDMEACEAILAEYQAKNPEVDYFIIQDDTISECGLD